MEATHTTNHPPVLWDSDEHQLHFVSLIEDAYIQLLTNSHPIHDHISQTNTINALHDFLKSVNSEVVG